MSIALNDIIIGFKQRFHAGGFFSLLLVLNSFLWRIKILLDVAVKHDPSKYYVFDQELNNSIIHTGGHVYFTAFLVH